ncbi:MAG: hypothetical protein PHS51_12730 [Gallionella sp.]|nr:hypothetical protein [Gallionella sp.]
MTTQWPNERERTRQPSVGHGLIDPKEELRRLLETCPAGLPTAFNETVDWISQQGEDTSELERRITEVCNIIELVDFPDRVNLLMAWACAKALAQAPSLQTWQKVRTLKSNSWQLEHGLSDAMLLCAEQHTNNEDTYIKLGKEVFAALDNALLKSQFEHNDKEREQFLTAWNENTEKLTEIWWGGQGICSMYYFFEEESPCFRILALLDSDEFIASISQAKNPALVSAAIWSSGVLGKLSFWSRFTASVPRAFADDGTWDGSVTLPLLLFIARDQLLQASGHIHHFGTLDSEVRTEVGIVIKNIIATLSKRPDALPLFARWSTWLMRQLLTRGIKTADDVRSSSFVDMALIDAIGQALQDKKVLVQSPSDAPAWEVWCYQAVLSSHANSRFIGTPCCKDFLAEWTISLDDWAGERGKRLRERANLMTMMTKEIPGDAAHALAYPIAMFESPVDSWVKLWRDTQSLREMVEFGDADASGSDEYQSRSEASKLLLLVFCIGLAVLDQRVGHCSTSNSPEARDLARLHESLFGAVREMCEVDDTSGLEQWLQALRHLAVRRLIWEEGIESVGKTGRFPVFTSKDQPTFSDYLSAAKNDVMTLRTIVESAWLNESNRQIIMEKLNAASINLSDVIETVKRLNVISDHRYPIDLHKLTLLSRDLTTRS